MKYTDIFDTHSHYDDERFDDDRMELLTQAAQNGIAGIVSCGCDIPSSLVNQRLAGELDNFYFACGLHPENLEECSPEDIDKLRALARDEKCVAIGEIGLDYHWMASTKEKQKEYFTAQIALANELDMPVIVHDREAHGDTLDILRQTKPKGVLHCFSGSVEMAREIIGLGMYIGLNGVVTFKNARKSLEVVRDIPLERLVLETDCPYLAPEPFRSKRNDSRYIPYIAERIGDLLGISTQEILDITCENARRLYEITL